MYLIRTTFKSKTSQFDTREEEYADTEKWLDKKISRIVDRWCVILDASDRQMLEQLGLEILVFELTKK